MMEKKYLTKYLECIFRHLFDWKMPVIEHFNCGLSNDFIISRFDEIDLNVPDELIELYCWKNGVKLNEYSVLENYHFIPGFYFISLSNAIAQYKIMKHDSRWNPFWFPFMANGGGDFYAVDLAKLNKDFCPIVGFTIDESIQEIEYENITAMMQTFCECFERNIVFKTNDGYLDLIDDDFSKIANKNNPTIDIWKT